MQPEKDKKSDLKDLDRRAWELWSIAILVMITLSMGFLSFLYPNLVWGALEIRLSASFLTQFFYALISLVVLLNIYLIGKQRTINDLRSRLIEERVKTEMHRQMAILDPLTEVYNRRYFEELIKKEVERARRHDKPLSLIIIDMDNFKDINEKYGHSAGDHVLQEVARLLKSTFRSTDSIIRYGGDEFIVLLPETGADGSRAAVRKLRTRLGEWNQKSEILDCSLGFSVGWATFTRELDFNEVLNEADRRLFEDKNKRRNNEKQVEEEKLGQRVQS